MTGQKIERRLSDRMDAAKTIALRGALMNIVMAALGVLIAVCAMFPAEQIEANIRQFFGF